MSSRQRLTYLAVAVVVAVVAFVVLSGGDDAAQQAATPTPTATAGSSPDVSAATPTATPTRAPRRQPPLLTAGQVGTLEVDQGDTVRFRVRNPEVEEVHVHGYDIARELPAGETVSVSFPATITGVFEIELEQSSQLLARLEVQP